MAAASVTNLRNVRQKLLTYLRIGETSTSTSIGGDAEEINDTSRIEDEDYWVGGQVHITLRIPRRNRRITKRLTTR